MSDPDFRVTREQSGQQSKPEQQSQANYLTFF